MLHSHPSLSCLSCSSLCLFLPLPFCCKKPASHRTPDMHAPQLPLSHHHVTHANASMLLALAFDTHSLSSTSDNVTTIASTSPTHAPPPVTFAFIPPAIINPILPTTAISLFPHLYMPQPPLPHPPPPLHPPISALPGPAPSVSPVVAIASAPCMTAIFALSAIVTAPALPTVITVTALVTPSPFVISTPMPMSPTAIPSLSTAVPTVVTPAPSISAITPMLMPTNSHLPPMPLLPNHAAISYLPTTISLPCLVKDVNKEQI
ncbi:hypothetical protein F5148DRAFT_1149371 [Russula earlei]|uniref:Uncharacterized protein n=1 Tax=Russula earlei TaxID=71964 RepID=A0ACC0U8M4_9AGAM|nr:hypothetical protein F5148DRAFT_1149371 [Russula earlei]